MLDLEAPTVPSSPVLSFDRSPATPSHPPTCAPPDLPARSLRRGTDVVKAQQTRCGICFAWMMGKYTQTTIDHLNACWRKYMQRARAEKQVFAEEDADLDVEVVAKDPFQDFDMVNMIPDDMEEDTVSTSSSSLSTFAEPLSPWLPRRTEIPPKMSCIFCFRDLNGLGNLDALQHRLLCTMNETPTCCPVCRGSFITDRNGISELWNPKDTLKHLHACQNDGDTDDSAKQVFENLLEAFTGRRTMLIRIVYFCYGKKANWTSSHHLAEYTRKRDAGRSRGGFGYKIDVTPLRRLERILPSREFVVGTEMEVEVCENAVVPDGVPLDRFKCSAFHILAPKSMAQVPRNFKEEKFIRIIAGQVDPVAFRGNLNLNKAPAPSSFRSNLDELLVGSVADEEDSPLIEGAAAENFPVVGDTLPESPQSRDQWKDISNVKWSACGDYVEKEEGDAQQGKQNQMVASLASPPSPLRILPPSFPPSHHSSLHPVLFLNPSELDGENHIETYDYPGRGAIPAFLRSNLCTVVNPRVSAQEQAERNRQWCMLNF